MFRRVQRIGTILVLSASWVCLGTGCDSVRSRLRPEVKTETGLGPGPVGEAAVESAGDQVLDVDSSSPRRFFKPSRLSGGLSSESREIERNLGIR